MQQVVNKAGIDEELFAQANNSSSIPAGEKISLILWFSLLKTDEKIDVGTKVQN